MNTDITMHMTIISSGPVLNVVFSFLLKYVFDFNTNFKYVIIVIILSYMKDKSTIGINKNIKKRLLNFVHEIEDATGARMGYSKAIEYLLDRYEGK